MLENDTSEASMDKRTEQGRTAWGVLSFWTITNIIIQSGGLERRYLVTIHIVTREGPALSDTDCVLNTIYSLSKSKFTAPGRGKSSRTLWGLEMSCDWRSRAEKKLILEDVQRCVRINTHFSLSSGKSTKNRGSRIKSSQIFRTLFYANTNQIQTQSSRQNTALLCFKISRK